MSRLRLRYREQIIRIWQLLVSFLSRILEVNQQPKSAFMISALNMMRVKLPIRLPNTQRINGYAKPWLVKSYPAPTHSAMIPKDVHAIHHNASVLYP